jgi:hypothetical protein
MPSTQVAPSFRDTPSRMPRLAEQIRKFLRKHYASKYRVR